jgi:hypothetical protein
MGRNKRFTSTGRAAPFEGNEAIQLVPSTVTGPLPFLNPTRARYRVIGTTDGEQEEGLVPGTEVRWRSRDNRKGEFWGAIVLVYCNEDGY